MTEASYVIVSPARNEGKYVEKTIQSVASQTLRPQRWVVVNDGSTDATKPLLEAAARRHSWITIMDREDRGFRKPGGGVIEAFYDGFSRAGDVPWEFIVKLDCDLSFEPDYFERLIKEFRDDSRLGIASGVYMEQRAGSGWLDIRMPPYHAAGACKVIRRECFEQIGGFIRNRGWDTVDEIRAATAGWRTAHFPALKMKHWKVEGSGIGQWRTNLMLGEIYYLTGGSGSFFALKVARKLLGRPLFVGGIGMLLGYARLFVRRQPALVTAAEAKCYRALLNARMAAQARKLLRLAN